jgi:GntR family transcriptional regulator
MSPEHTAAQVRQPMNSHRARITFGHVATGLARALQHIRAMNAPAQLASRLGVPEGHALLFITRVGYTEQGQAVELTHSYCRSDHYDFVAEMRRSPA